MAFDLVVAPGMECLYGSYAEEELPLFPHVWCCEEGGSWNIPFVLRASPCSRLEQNTLMCMYHIPASIPSVLSLLPIYLFISLSPSFILFCLTVLLLLKLLQELDNRLSAVSQISDWCLVNVKEIIIQCRVCLSVAKWFVCLTTLPITQNIRCLICSC